MRISYARIENFRNFKKCEVNLGQNIVLIGENKAGKSNFITALRLVLDPLQNRQLVSDDFWGGSGYPFDGRSIQVTVRITDFGGENPDLVPLTWLSPCLIEKDPPIAQLTYLYYPDVNEEEQQLFPKQYTADDYKWMIYPKDDPSQKISLSGMWQDMPLNFINALRDIASDSNVWSRSPLNELIKLSDDISSEKIQPYADEFATTSQKMVDNLLKSLGEEINSQLIDMVGQLYNVDPRLGLDITSPDAVLKALRVFVDGDQNRSISRTSLGLQNAIYLSLLSLQLDKKLQRRQGKNKQHYLPIVTLEEPEAHLHPHLQRLVFKNFLDKAQARNLPVIISSHSPYLVSAADIADLVLIKDDVMGGGKAFSAYEFLKKIKNERERKDLDRFLDITKSEMVFAKAVLFVEGDVEILLVKTFMDVLGIDLDEYGISVCNVYGVNFYHVAMLAVKLGIPFAVLTDGDKFNTVTGLQRGIDLTKVFENENGIKATLQGQYDSKTVDNDVVRKELAKLGIFVNDWTLEPTLIEAGLTEELKLTFQELGDELGQNVRAGSNHIDTYLANPTDENMKNILTTISDTRWGKGRFAHRLCTHILTRAETIGKDKRQQIVPAYIFDAVNHLIKQVTPQDSDKAGEDVK